MRVQKYVIAEANLGAHWLLVNHLSLNLFLPHFSQVLGCTQGALVSSQLHLSYPGNSFSVCRDCRAEASRLFNPQAFPPRYFFKSTPQASAHLDPNSPHC